VPSQVSFWAGSSQKSGSTQPAVKSLEVLSQSEPKLKQFAAITPHPLLLNHSMALVCDQSVMFCCETNSCWTICTKPTSQSKVSKRPQPVLAQTEAVYSHYTSSIAAEPLHGPGM
jgi:hypothetical protein